LLCLSRAFKNRDEKAVGISAAAAMIIEEDLDKEVAFISKMHDENNTQQVVDTDEIEL